MTNNKAKDIINIFFSNYPEFEYSKNQLVINDSDQPKYMYYIKSGKVRMYDISVTGYKLTLNVLSANACFSIAWAYGNNNNFSFDCLEKSTIIKCPLEDFRNFINSHPQVIDYFLYKLTNGFDGLFKRLSVHMGGTASNRIITELLIEAWRFSNQTTRKKRIDISINDLTSATGLARETVSREVSKLINNDLLQKSGHRIFITDIKKLEKIIL